MTDSPAPIIRMRGICKKFGEFSVLNNLDLDIMAGQHVSIIGPSGSGKSTILRLLMTLEKPDAGTIEIDGDYLWQVQRNDCLVPARAAHVRQVRSKVGMVFQHFHLFPHMNVLRNVTEAPMHVRGMSRKDAEEKANLLLFQVGLADKLNAYPQQLSGGQKQRVAIARALAMEPKIMLFDEVTSALDPELIGEVQAVLRDLATRTDMTMLFVTHQMNFAREVSDRVIFLDAGRVIEDGNASTVLSNPNHERTCTFLRSVLAAT
jgi:polar amino acid transport system ATP-binding protein